MHELPRVRIHIGKRVLHLPLLQQHWRDSLIARIHQLKQWVFRAMLQGKLTLQHVAGVGVPQHRMAEAGDHLTLLQGLVGEIGHQILGGLLTPQLLLDVQKPGQALLVGEAMEGTGQATEARGPGVVRIA